MRPSVVRGIPPAWATTHPLSPPLSRATLPSIPDLHRPQSATRRAVTRYRGGRKRGGQSRVDEDGQSQAVGTMIRSQPASGSVHLTSLRWPICIGTGGLRSRACRIFSWGESKQKQSTKTLAWIARTAVLPVNRQLHHDRDFSVRGRPPRPMMAPPQVHSVIHHGPTLTSVDI